MGIAGGQETQGEASILPMLSLTGTVSHGENIADLTDTAFSGGKT